MGSTASDLAAAETALSEAFTANKQRLWRTIQIRLEPKLWSRLDPEDVLQESFVNAINRLDAYRQQTSYSPFVWLRLVVGQTLINLHRKHLGAQSRNAFREANSIADFRISATAELLIDQIVGRQTSPSRAAVRQESVAKLEAALDDMKPMDREVLTLRHFEDLSNKEVAQLLSIEEKNASIRYIRALKRLRSAMAELETD